MTKDSEFKSQTISCEQCHGVFAIETLRPSVTCSFCGHHQAVDAAVLQSMASYASNVDNALEMGAQEKSVAALHQFTARSFTGAWKAVLFCVVPPFVLAGIGALLFSAGILNSREHGAPFAISLLVVSYIFVLAYVIHYFIKRSSAKASQAKQIIEEQATCPKCGASNPFEAGAQVETCAYCGAAMMPSRDLRNEMVDQALDAHRSAAMDRHRAERAVSAAASANSLNVMVFVYGVCGMVLLGLGVAAGGVTNAMYTGAEPFNAGAIITGWGLFLGGGATVIIILTRARQQRVMLRQGVETLASDLRGTVLDPKTGEINWLNQYWTGPFDAFHLFHGSNFQCAELTISEHKVFVHLNPNNQGQYPAGVLLMIPCDVPSSNRSDPAVGKAVRSRLSAEGFTVAISEAGLLATAEEAVVSQIKRFGGIDQLRGSIMLLVELAHILEAKPVSPFPLTEYEV